MPRRVLRRAAHVPALALATCLLPAPSAAAVGVPQKIEFAKTAPVPPRVREQCNLQTLIPGAIADHSSDAKLVEGAGDLALEITAVHAPGGWIFSGPKWIEVQGTLRRDGKSLGFRAKRYSAFDPFSGGTCGILAKIARALGSDIAVWLANPSDGVELGDAQ